MVLLRCRSVYGLAVSLSSFYPVVLFSLCRGILPTVSAGIFTLYILLLFVIFSNRWMMIWEECVLYIPTTDGTPSDVRVTRTIIGQVM